MTVFPHTHVLALAGLLLLTSATVHCEVATPDSPTSRSDEPPALTRATPPADLKSYESNRFQVLPLVAIVADYTAFDQDDRSLGQVGVQNDTADLRAARLGAALRSKDETGWSLFFAVDYQESRTREDETFQLYDLRLRVPVGDVKIDIGKQKQPFVFEVAGLSILNPQQERILSPFFVTRSIGVRASGPLAGDRMTWSAGWYNDWLETDNSFSDNANDWVGRLTGLVSVSPDNLDYLHLGLGLRRLGADDGTMRFRGRPGSNVADYYVDTGDFAADHATQLGLELVWNHGPFLVAAEHVVSRVNADASDDPYFYGSYAMFSWMLTGESRPYLRELGSTGTVIPRSERGAIELVARYSHLNLNDKLIQGGELDKWHLGVNWWLSRQWKAGLSWGAADLDRFGVEGQTDMVLTRLQWYLP